MLCSKLLTVPGFLGSSVIREEQRGGAGQCLSSDSFCIQLACSWASLAALWPPWLGAVGSGMKQRLRQELWLSPVFLGLFGGEGLGCIVQSQWWILVTQRRQRPGGQGRGVQSITTLSTPVTGIPLQQAEKPFAAANYRGRNGFLLQGDKGEDISQTGFHSLPASPPPVDEGEGGAQRAMGPRLLCCAFRISRGS